MHWSFVFLFISYFAFPFYLLFCFISSMLPHDFRLLTLFVHCFVCLVLFIVLFVHCFVCLVLFIVLFVLFCSLFCLFIVLFVLFCSLFCLFCYSFFLLFIVLFVLLFIVLFVLFIFPVHCFVLKTFFTAAGLGALNFRMTANKSMRKGVERSYHSPIWINVVSFYWTCAKQPAKNLDIM